MKFPIPSETFVRMANAAARPTDDLRPHLACVRLEYRDGKYFCVASTSWVIAVEYLGDTTEPNGFVNVPTHTGLLDNMRVETGLNVEFDWWSEFNVLTCATYPTITLEAVPDTEPMFTRWPSIFPATLPRVDNGFLFIQAEYFQRLADASPSGKLCFPEVIDSRDVVIVRDKDDPNWVGAFAPVDKLKQARPALRPEWLP